VHACLKLRIVRARGMQETKRSRIEAPEIAENGNDLQQSGVRIGTRHNIPWPIVGVLRCGTASLWHMSTRFPSTSRELLRNLLPRHERALGALDVIWWRKHQRRLLR